VYNDIYSGAIDSKTKAIDTTNIVKQKVDEVRRTLSGAEDVLKDTLKTIDDTKQNIDKLQKI
jgi:hypothetical protein